MRGAYDKCRAVQGIVLILGMTKTPAPQKKGKKSTMRKAAVDQAHHPLPGVFPRM